jgi:hypothetical protein
MYELAFEGLIVYASRTIITGQDAWLTTREATLFGVPP